MKSLIFALFVAYVAGVQIEQAIDFDNDDPTVIVDLNDKNFDRKLKKGAPMLVEFYAPWCGHCKQFAPDYAKAANELKKRDITLYKIDGSKNMKTVKRFGIEGFPSLRWIKDTEGDIVSEYPSTATMLKAESVYRWVIKKMSPSCQELTTLFDDEVFTDNDSAYTIAFYEDFKDQELQAFEDIADEMEKFAFAKTRSPELFEMYDVKPPAILHFTKYGKQRKHVMERDERMLGDNFNATEFKEIIQGFVFESSFPAPFEFDKKHTTDTIRKLRRHSRFVNMLLLDNKKDNTEVKEAFVKAAEEMKPEVLFTIMHSDLPDSTNPMEVMNIEHEHLPTVVLRASRNAKWTLTKDKISGSSAELSKTFSSFVNDSLLRKNPIDTPPPNKGFVHMSSDNFTEVLKANHPMVVLFHNEKSYKSEKFRVRMLRAVEKVKAEKLDVRLGFLDILNDWDLNSTAASFVNPAVDETTVQIYTFKGPHPEISQSYKLKTEHVNATVWLMHHLKSIAGERCPEITSAKTISEMRKKDDLVTIGFMETGDEEAVTHLEKGAAATTGGLWGWTKDPAIAKKFKVTPPGIATFRKFDTPRIDFPGDENHTDINNASHIAFFMRLASTPTILDFSDKTAQHMIDNGPLCQLLLFTKLGKQKDPTPERKAMEVLSGYYKGHVLHVTIPSNLKGPMNFFKLKNKDIPAIIWVDKVNNHKATFNKATTLKEAKIAKHDWGKEESELELIDVLAYFVKGKAAKFAKKWDKELQEAQLGGKPKITEAPAKEVEVGDDEL